MAERPGSPPLTGDGRTVDLPVAGDLNPDILVVDPDPAPEFGQVEKLVRDIRLTIGGSSGIAAAGAARLGLRVSFCGVVGHDELGGWMLDAMAARGVDVGPCRVEPATPTGATVVLSRGDDRAILTATGTIGELRGEDLPEHLLRRCRHLHVGSTAIQPQLRADLPGVFRLARTLGVTTSFDANWDPDGRWDGTPALLATADICFPNAAEARPWTGLADPVAAAHALADGSAAPREASAGPLTVALKAGAAGAITVRGDQVVR